MTSILRNLLLVGAAFTLSAPAKAAEKISAEQATEIQGLIKEYIMNNPETIAESMDLYQKRQEQERAQSAIEALKSNMDALTSADSPSAGNPDGEIVVVEFFDYNCGYCKKALDDIQGVIDNEKDVRVVFKEMPILGPSSLTAAQWALAAGKQDKYFEFHTALMEHRGQKDEASLTKMAKKLDLDVDQMKKDAGSKEINSHIQADIALARKVGIQGTPAFIIGDELFPGYLGDGGLKREIATARK